MIAIYSALGPYWKYDLSKLCVCAASENPAVLYL